MQTGCHGAYVGSRLKRLRPRGRCHLKCQPSSRTGENPPYGMIGGIEETSASFEARYAPRSYPTGFLRFAEQLALDHAADRVRGHDVNLLNLRRGIGRRAQAEV